jgi:hypothetical protein
MLAAKLLRAPLLRGSDCSAVSHSGLTEAATPPPTDPGCSRCVSGHCGLIHCTAYTSRPPCSHRRAPVTSEGHSPRSHLQDGNASQAVP